MEKIKLSEILNTANVRRTIALMMALTLLTFAGCDQNPNTSSSGGSSSESSQVESSSDVSSEDTSTSDVSSTDSTQNSSTDTTTPSSQASDVTMTSSYINPLDGEISVEDTYELGGVRTDAYEAKPTVDPSNLAYNYVGYAEDERNALLEEILNTKNTLEYYTPAKDAKIFYVSPGGNNANDGLSPENAFQSIDALYGCGLQEGDFVLFERNSLYRMYEQFLLQKGITYGSYGEGTKPMFYGSAKNFAKEAWQPSKKKNVWQINYMYQSPTGAFFNEGEEIGYLKLTMRDLEKNTDFFLDAETATLYLYCDKGNPGNVWDSIEISQENVTFRLNVAVQHVVVDNIAIRYCGPGGVSGLYGNNYITVTNCEIGYTGGQWLGAVRAGNGIGTWVGGEYLYWDHNWVYQTFDSGMSPQGNVGRNLFDYHDISMSDNLMEFNNADFESWESGKENPSKYYNYFMNNNICRFTSLGWGTREDDGGIRGIDGVNYGRLKEDQIIGEYTFNNNIIDCPGRMVYKFTTENEAVYKAWTRTGNKYFIKQSLRTTNALTYLFHWENGEHVSTSATSEEATLAAFARFEPDAEVHWYK